MKIVGFNGYGKKIIITKTNSENVLNILPLHDRRFCTKA